MTRKTFTSLLFTIGACAQPTAGPSEDGKFDFAPTTFRPEFCGTNFLESGPVFVDQVCVGKVTSGKSLVTAVQVRYFRDDYEVYAAVATADEGSKRTLTVVGPSKAEQELTIGLNPATLEPANIQGTVEQGPGFYAELKPVVQQVTCQLRRPTGVFGAEEIVDASIILSPDDVTADSDSIVAFEGTYSFSLIQRADDPELHIKLFETAHLEDQVNAINCYLPENTTETTFCQADLELDASLGTAEPERMVKMFDFWCDLSLADRPGAPAGGGGG